MSSALGTLVVALSSRKPKRCRPDQNDDEKEASSPAPAPFKRPQDDYQLEQFEADKQRLKGETEGASVATLDDLFAGQPFSRFAESYTAAQRHELREVLRRRFEKLLETDYYSSSLAMRQLLQKTAQSRLKRALVWAFMNGWLTLDEDSIKLAYIPLFAQGLQTYGSWLRTQMACLFDKEDAPPSTYMGGSSDLFVMAMTTNNLETLELLRQMFPVRIYAALWEEAAKVDRENFQRILPATRTFLKQRLGVQVKEEDAEPEEDEPDEP